MIILTPIKEFQFPVHAECINPDIFKGKSMAEIFSLAAWEGNRKKKLGDLFKIEESPAKAPDITINGNVSEVRRVGQGMKTGEIVINGDASDYLASPYRGSTDGMRGGTIVVDGNIGSDSGCYLRGGAIMVKGNAGPFLGFHMSKGVIYVEKNAGSRLGAGMIGGKIVVLGFVDELMPTFTVDGVKAKVKVDDNFKAVGPFYVFLGDLAEHGKGKLFVSKANNPQLKNYEAFL